MTLAEQLQYLKFSVRKNDPKSQQHSLDALQWGLIPYWAKDPKIAYRTINA
jgi:putative SOS response-associated peptidase YedK